MNFLRQFLFFLLLALLSLPSHAQRKISGEVVDESDKAKLKQASVMLLQAKDSILVDFARVQENGKFQMLGLMVKVYIINYCWWLIVRYKMSIIF